MGKEIKFDFCIIPNPFAIGDRDMVFIAKTGDNFLDKTISDTKEYQDVKEILEQFGYTETNDLQFESSDNSHITGKSEIVNFLEECGLTYSRELEVNIIRDLNNLKEESDKAINNNLDYVYGTEEFSDFNYSPIGDKTKNKLMESKSELFKYKYREPGLREKVTLYFYLFIELGFNQFGKPVIQFGGDFKDSEDYDDRNYIKIVKSEFERVGDPKKPNAIILSSCKNQGDLLKEIGILYSGYFKYQRNFEKDGSMFIKETKYPYKIAEVKKHINPDQAIVVETNRMGFDKLMDLSTKIQNESVIESKQKISVDEIESEAVELSKFLSRKMTILSDNDEFEEAAKMKKEIDFIEDKVNLIKDLDKYEITTEEYFNIFSLS